VSMSSSVIPEVDYPHLPGQEYNPLMESTLHASWTTMLINAVRHTLADVQSDALVTGNVPFVPNDGGAHTAPDLMVIPGMIGRQFRRYVVDVDGRPPSACVEVISPSSSKPQIDRRVGRWLACGVDEVYVLDPERETVNRVRLDKGVIVAEDARGAYSPAMNLTFAQVDGRLALCCPAGRTVRVEDDPFGWLAVEQRRADRAELAYDQIAEQRDQIAEQRDQIAEQRDAALAELGRLRAEVARLRGGPAA
jgi:Putative restriction endonuclease